MEEEGCLTPERNTRVQSNDSPLPNGSVAASLEREEPVRRGK